MGIIIRQSIYSSIITYIGYAIGAVNALFLYTHFLTDTEKGIIDSIQLLVMSFVSFGSVGVFQVVNKFLPYYKTHLVPQKNDLFAKTLVYGLTALVTSGLIVFCFRSEILVFLDNSPQLLEHIHLFPIFAFGYFSHYLMSAFCVGYQQIIYNALIQDVFVRAYNTLLIVLYIYKIIDYDALMLWLSFQYWIAAAFIFARLYAKGLMRFVWKSSSVTTRLYKKMIQYVSVYWLAILSIQLSTLIDKLVILDLKGLSNVAYFTVAEYLITILLVPQKAITNSATPIIADAWRKNDTSEISALYIKAANNLTWTGGLLYILLLVNINHIFALFPASYGVGKPVFIILGIAKMIDFATSINSQILIYSKKYYLHELIFASILTVLLIPITYLLVSTYGIIGSAWAQVICLFIVNLVRIIFLWKMCGMNPFKTNYKIFLAFSTAIILAIWYAKTHDIAYDMSIMQNILFSAINSILIAATLFFILVRFNLSPELNKFLSSKIDFMHKIKK